MCCCVGPALWGFWFQTDLGRENSASFFKYRRGFGHALRPIFMLWLVKILQVSSCGKFMQHLESCYFDSWSWQSFASTCDVFNCLFPLDVQNEIQLLLWVFCYSWLVCLLGIWLRNASLVKADNPIRMTLLDAWENYKGSRDPCLTWSLSGAASRNMVSLSNYCIYI